jgi:hypothetical protein
MDKKFKKYNPIQKLIHWTSLQKSIQPKYEQNKEAFKNDGK